MLHKWLYEWPVTTSHIYQLLQKYLPLMSSLQLKCWEIRRWLTLRMIYFIYPRQSRRCGSNNLQSLFKQTMRQCLYTYGIQECGELAFRRHPYLRSGANTATACWRAYKIPCWYIGKECASEFNRLPSGWVWVDLVSSAGYQQGIAKGYCG